MSNPILGDGGFHHVAIRATDWQRSVDFYTQILGFTEKVRWGEGDKRGILLDSGDGNYFEIFAGRKSSIPPGSPEQSFLHIALRTTRLDDVIARVTEAGMKVTIKPADVTIKGNPFDVPLRLAFFEGPDGEVIELFQNTLT